MADLIQISAGVALLALTFYDFGKTAIGTAGMGPISRRVARWQWRLARAIVPRLKTRTELRLERAIGPVILCTIAACWVLTNWAGYTLLFAVEGALGTPEGGPASVPETIAFAGVSLSTLGAGLARPGSGWWDVLSAVAAINGMIVLTLSVSFMMNVGQTTAKARALALRVSALDAIAPELDDHELTGALGALGPALIDVVVGIRGVPVVSYFSTGHARMNLPLAIAALRRLVERIGEAPVGQGTAELWAGLVSLAEQQGDTEARNDPLRAVSRWAEDHRLDA